MPNDRLIDDLVAGLTPVRRRSMVRDGSILLVLGAVEIALFLFYYGMRPDMPQAMAAPSFWWKTVSLIALVLIAGVTALRSFDPAASPRRGLRLIAVVVAVAIGLGWAIDAASGGATMLLARLDPREGLACVLVVVALSLPALLAFGVLMRRGAPTDPRGSAAAVGLTAAAWGAFVFVFNCPHDDPLYIALWYSVGVGAVALLGRLILPRLTRW